MSGQNPSEAQKTDSMSEDASRHTLALNPLVAFGGKDLVDSAGVAGHLGVRFRGFERR